MKQERNTRLKKRGGRNLSIDSYSLMSVPEILVAERHTEACGWTSIGVTEE